MNRSLLALCAVALGSFALTVAGCQPAPLESAQNPADADDGDGDGDGVVGTEDGDGSGGSDEPGRATDGGDGGVDLPGEYSCAEVCAGDASCDNDNGRDDERGDDGDGCLDSCSQAAGVLQEDALVRVAECMATIDCADLSVDDRGETERVSEFCFGQEECYGTDPLGLRATLCERIGECDSRFDVDECVAGDTDDFATLGCLIDDVAADAIACIADSSCEDLPDCLPFQGDRGDGDGRHDDDDGRHDDDPDDGRHEEGDPADRLCDEVCHRLAECGEDYEDCQQGCHSVTPVLAEEHLREFAGCVLEAECRDFPRDDEGKPDAGAYCFSDMECVDPESRHVEAIGHALCEARERCDDGRGDQECRFDRHEMSVFGCFADDAIDQIVGCMEDSPCHEVGDCMPFDDDEDHDDRDDERPADPEEIVADCARACDHIVACDDDRHGGDDEGARQQRFSDCLDECGLFSEFISERDRRDIVDCVVHSECRAAGFDEHGNPGNLAEHCLLQADCAEADSHRTHAVAEAICHATERCGDGREERCDVPEEVRVFGCFYDESIHRITSCLERADCEQVKSCVPFQDDRPDDHGGPGDGHGGDRCEQACDELQRCGHDSDECMMKCRGIQEAFVGEAFDQLTDCTIDRGCEVRGPDGQPAGFDACFGAMQCLHEPPEGNHDFITDPICDAQARCGFGMEDGGCDFRQIHLMGIACFADHAIGGMAECLDNSPCDEVRQCSPFWQEHGPGGVEPGPDEYCADVCEQVAECNADNDASHADAVEQCRQECIPMHGIFRPEVLGELAQCVFETPCADAVDADGERDLGRHCAESLDCARPDGPAEELSQGLCDAQNRCAPEPGDVECFDTPDDLRVAGCFGEHALRDMLRCLAEAPCDEVIHCVPGAHEGDNGGGDGPL